jgi:PrcB C-terminal
VTYTHVFGNDRLRRLPWQDLTGRVGALRFAHGTTRQLPGPKTFALYLREHGFRGRPPAIDFDRRDVVVLAVGPRSTTGYTLEVVSLVERRRRVEVTLRERTPALGDPVRVRTTYPFRLITFPKTGKSAFLHIEGRP